jgi:hypothetical protein
MDQILKIDFHEGSEQKKTKKLKIVQTVFETLTNHVNFQLHLGFTLSQT